MGSTQSLPRLLVADDEPALREMLAEVLSDAGYDVTVAADGSAALALLSNQGPFDLILVDEDMPGLTGRRVLAAARGLGMHAPALLWSGHLELGDDEQLRLGVACFLRKPVEIKALREAIRKALDPPSR